LVNFAVTVVFDEIWKKQELVPVQGPDHPAKIEPGAAAAMSVTVEPGGLNVALHVFPQPMPPTLLVTVPAPSPDFVAVSVAVVVVDVVVGVAEVVGVVVVGVAEVVGVVVRVAPGFFAVCVAGFAAAAVGIAIGARARPAPGRRVASRCRSFGMIFRSADVPRGACPPGFGLGTRSPPRPARCGQPAGAPRVVGSVTSPSARDC
jgi:hypothetical protein